jgi:uncharacterized protein
MKHCTIILFLIFSISSFGQSQSDIDRMINLNGKDRKENYEFARSIQNEYDLIFSGLFLFYKSFISSQDGSHCTFTPSCSVYALQSIKKQGIVVGTIDFFDRFARCNGLSSEHYEVDLINNRLIDPLKNSRYE